MREPRPFEPLYDAVALGMSVFVETAFRVRRVGPQEVELREGDLVVATHRAETDVPLICGRLYWAMRMLWRRRIPRLHFAAREDLFERGFFAGFPDDLPLLARRVLYPIAAGPLLPRVRVNPLPYPSTAELRLGRALAALAPATPLAEALPPQLVCRFEARAREAGLTPPRTAGEALAGAYADLLWETYGRDVLGSPLLEEAWRARRRQAAEQVRRVVDLLRSGAPLLFFPEGRPSPDGAIGPLRAGVRLLIERGRPRAILPLGIAYDPLTVGRPFAFFAVGERAAPPETEVDGAVLDLMRRTLPLTCGQPAAARVRAAAAAGEEALAPQGLGTALGTAVEAAEEAGRPLDPALLDRAQRARRLQAFVRWLERRRLARAERGALRLDPAAVLADPLLARAAREHESAGGSP